MFYNAGRNLATVDLKASAKITGKSPTEDICFHRVAPVQTCGQIGHAFYHV
jgi:hypothetical protein